ncbi:DUF6602 domain-containing protein [Pseudogulbenkiania subflava]|uniref:DUF6602 domain-containing protein n=1 Tax=Pseudogulbenkiania subflava DSM 22618 TaxID=1123014 RepID=A0A1Y6BUK5_9NEIS|nr:DUF6602 domain-containing protein [Pseudogulbenkiania subflava]SMF22090.1 hypothetical protein SAMN02745746_01946 [Pseudogulbenkiania subflava DSM 22618]
MNSITNQIQTIINNAVNEFANDFINCRELFSTLDSRNGLTHSGEFGMYRERICKKLIEKFVASDMKIGDGFIINKNGESSNQSDLIVFDRDHTLQIESGGAKFFPCETTYAIGEVKSKLDEKGLKEALARLIKAKKIRSHTPAIPTPIKPNHLPHFINKIASGAYDGDEHYNPYRINKFGDFQGLIDYIENGTCDNFINDVLHNIRLFEQLNIVTFLICEEIKDIEKIMSDTASPFNFCSKEDEPFRINLILSLNDGLIFHCYYENNALTPYPFPMKLGEKMRAIFFPNKKDGKNLHIVKFIQLLSWALYETAIYQFVPMGYYKNQINIITPDCKVISGG